MIRASAFVRPLRQCRMEWWRPEQDHRSKAVMLSGSAVAYSASGHNYVRPLRMWRRTFYISLRNRQWDSPVPRTAGGGSDLRSLDLTCLLQRVSRVRLS